MKDKVYSDLIEVKRQVEEARKIKEEVRSQLKVKEQSIENLECQVVLLRNIDKASEQLSDEKISEYGSMSLDKIIGAQKAPSDKSGLGLEEGQCSKIRKTPRTKIDLNFHVADLETIGNKQHVDVNRGKRNRTNKFIGFNPTWKGKLMRYNCSF